MKKYFSKITSCFDVRADFNSVLYSRCILYLVLLLSLINLFYLIQIQDAQTVMVFLLSGFVASFFIKNMIIIISFAIMVSVVYHYWPLIKAGTLPHITINYSENFEDAEEEKKEETMTDDEEDAFKYQYQGQIDPNSNTEKEPNKEEEKQEVKEDGFDDTAGDDTKSGKSSTKVTEIRKDMTKYFEIQQKLLDLFEQAEPLQKEAEAYKEKFQNK